MADNLTVEFESREFISIEFDARIGSTAMTIKCRDLYKRKVKALSFRLSASQVSEITAALHRHLADP